MEASIRHGFKRQPRTSRQLIWFEPTSILMYTGEGRMGISNSERR
jgi:hypothetical protein